MGTIKELYPIFHQSKWHPVHWKHRFISARFSVAQCQSKLIQEIVIVVFTWWAEPIEYRFRLCVFFVLHKSKNCIIISKLLPNVRLVREISMEFTMRQSINSRITPELDEYAALLLYFLQAL